MSIIYTNSDQNNVLNDEQPKWPFLMETHFHLMPATKSGSVISFTIVLAGTNFFLSFLMIFLCYALLLGTFGVRYLQETTDKQPMWS